MAEPNRLAAALSYEQDRPAFGNPSMLEQGRKMRERKQAEQVDRSAQKVKSDLLARALMYRYNPETLTGLTDTPGSQTLDEAAGLNPRVDRSTFLPYSKKEGLHVPAVVADVMKLATASNPQYSNLMQPEEAMPLATNMMGGGIGASRVAPPPAGSLGMNVWHGSPHRFPPTAKNPLGEFDPTKIGTGEGAQAYGHGAGYLAEAKGTAKGYAETLANRDIANQGRLNAHANAQRLANLAGDAKYAADDVRYALETNPQGQEQLLRDTLQHLESGSYARPLENKGNLYKVDLPDEHIAKMLDWDKPLSQQSADVKKAISSDPRIARLIASGKIDDMYQSGGEFYRAVNSKYANDAPAHISLDAAENAAQANASRYLKSLGIPGIRYLDEGSRNAALAPYWNVIRESDGVTVAQKVSDEMPKIPTGFRAEGPIDKRTRNFVVFDPAHMNIIGRE